MTTTKGWSSCFEILYVYYVKQINALLYLRAALSSHTLSTLGTEGATAVSYLAAQHKTVQWNGNTPLILIPIQVWYAFSNTVTVMCIMLLLYSWRDSQLHRH